jgi:hypothetical protein
MVRLCKAVSHAWVNPRSIYLTALSKYCLLEFMEYTIQ